MFLNFTVLTLIFISNSSRKLFSVIRSKNVLHAICPACNIRKTVGSKLVNTVEWVSLWRPKQNLKVNNSKLKFVRWPQTQLQMSNIAPCANGGSHLFCALFAKYTQYTGGKICIWVLLFCPKKPVGCHSHETSDIVLIIIIIHKANVKKTPNFIYKV